MSQSPTQTQTPTPESFKAPELKTGAPLTDAEKKAQADKAQPQVNPSIKA